MKKTFILFVFIFGLSLLNLTLKAQNQRNKYWPKVIPLENMSITIYQPEIESINKNHLEARAAFNIYDGTKLPVFGAIWLRARVQVDHTAKSVFYDDLEMMDVNFPDATAAKKKEFKQLLAAVTPTWEFSSSLDDFYGASEKIKINEESSNALDNNPPNIFYEKVRTELVFVDGEPILENIDGSVLYQHIVNTPNFIVHSTSDGYFYLRAGIWWYRAKHLYDEWKNIATPPQPIINLDKKFNTYNHQASNELITNSSRKPQLIAVAHPAVLIETNGEAETIPISGTSLMYVSNTENDLLKDNDTNEFFVRFSGRWYKSKTLMRGAWSFVAPSELPVDFKKIPVDSKIAHIRLSVPETPESMSAALDNAIPQTAIVDRKTAKMSVIYDGEPEFKPIDGTTLSFAINTSSSVLKTANNVYYAVDEAIWFTSDSPDGSWTVATTAPNEVQKIPPSSPIYNIKFVYVYDYSPEYVYVGYTGGYLGSYLFQGCLFYGTGYQYKPWYKSKYIARPVTYAFGVNRTQSKSNISVSVGVGFGYPGFYSPYGYYGGYGGYGYGYGSYYSTTVTGNYELKKGYESKPLDQVNIYNNRAQGIIVSDQVRRNNPFEILPENQEAIDGSRLPPTNLYSDRAGDIYKQDTDGTWSKRVDGVWVKTKKNPKN